MVLIEYRSPFSPFEGENYSQPDEYNPELAFFAYL